MNVLEMTLEGKMTVYLPVFTVWNCEDYLHLLDEVNCNFIDWQNVYIHFYMYIKE